MIEQKHPNKSWMKRFFQVKETNTEHRLQCHRTESSWFCMFHGAHLRHLRNCIGHVMVNYICLIQLHFLSQLIIQNVKGERKSRIFACKIPSKVSPLKHAVRSWKANMFLLLYMNHKRKGRRRLLYRCKKKKGFCRSVWCNYKCWYFSHALVLEDPTPAELIDETTLSLYFLVLTSVMWGKGQSQKIRHQIVQF